MTKAKTAKTAAGAAKKPAKAAKEVKEVKEAVEVKKKQPPKAPAAPPAAPPAAAKKKTAKAHGDTDALPAPAAKAHPAPSASMPFSNAGLAVKTSGKKPALSVSPDVMTLGRAAQPRQQEAPRPSERRLAKKELADIKTFLLEKRERLLAGMRRELAMQKERAASKAADDVDKATDAYDEDLSFEIATANDQELEDIQVALEKIEKGTYGECEVCGCGISPSRLKILPSATTCVACRGQEELTRRRDDGQQLFNMLEDGEGETETM